MERKEIFGDELVDLLDSVGIRIPELDYGDESIWPPPFFALVLRAAKAEGDRGTLSESVQEPPRIVEAPVAQPVSDESGARGGARPLTGYRRRFTLIYVALALVAGWARAR